MSWLWGMFTVDPGWALFGASCLLFAWRLLWVRARFLEAQRAESKSRVQESARAWRDG